MEEIMAETTIERINEEIRLDADAAILRAEESYERNIAMIAERVVANENIKLILLAGPSGSGKTTTANLVADAIRARGEEAMVVSLDDFYRNSDDPEYPRLADGSHDFECPESLDLPKVEATLKRIVSGEEFEIPKYSFKSGSCRSVKRYAPIKRGCVIIEGLHALNPKIGGQLPSDKALRIFVSVSTNINEGNERIISGRKIRFVRRLVRDSIFRGTDARRTLNMWSGVLAAEDVYLYPYKATADIAFDTFHTFELSAMRAFAEAQITPDVASESEYAAIVLAALKKIEPIDYNKVPTDSLIREFLPGGVYEHLY